MKDFQKKCPEGLLKDHWFLEIFLLKYLDDCLGEILEKLLEECLEEIFTLIIVYVHFASVNGNAHDLHSEVDLIENKNESVCTKLWRNF